MLRTVANPRLRYGVLTCGLHRTVWVSGSNRTADSRGRKTVTTDQQEPRPVRERARHVRLTSRGRDGSAS